jgi:prepilin-type N-terminal cleavage/methylation domain-containing protein/prepilin-type processing-associated H-X9-DG protein
MIPQPPFHRRRAFTLIELLVVIGIIALLVAILLPALGQARAAARLSRCLVNVRSIGQALTLYADEHRETFPHWSGWHIWDASESAVPVAGDADGPAWTELLKPYLDGREVYVDPSRPRDLAPFGYFMQARHTFIRTQRAYTSLRTAEVNFASAFVLAGDCNNPLLYAAPYGTTSNQPDCDQDDATQPAVFFAGELSAHAGRSNLLFADVHSATHTRYRPEAMTWRGDKMVDWASAQ